MSIKYIAVGRTQVEGEVHTFVPPRGEFHYWVITLKSGAVIYASGDILMIQEGNDGDNQKG